VIPLLGFSPDVEPTTPGCILDMQGIIPYEAGAKAAPTPAAVGVNTLAAACQGAAVVRQLAGTSRFIAGTASNLYEASGVSWTSVGSPYTLGADDVWSFAGFGDSVLASNASTNIQRSTGGAFSTIAAAPKAKLLVASKGFIVGFATNDATYGDSPDRWWCSALYDETTWTPSLATQAATGRLVEGSGPITAAMRFGDQIVAYKSRAMHLGHYAGTPSVWDWAVVSFDVGCVGPEAVADTSIGHIFVGSDNIYHFDGTRPVAIATGSIRQWWLDNSSAEYRYRTKLLWDRDNSLVWIFFPSAGSSAGVCDDCIVFHVATKQWGRSSMTVEAVVNYVSPSITYDGGSALITTFDSGPSIPFDSPFWLSQKTNPAIFSTSHIVQTLSGVPGAWWFETGDYGDEVEWSYCQHLSMRFAAVPSPITCTPKTRDTSGDTVVAGSSSSFDGAKFPLRQTSRFHRFRIDGEGSGKWSAIQPATSPAGIR
jgi:hypothetical protein